MVIRNNIHIDVAIQTVNRQKVSVSKANKKLKSLTLSEKTNQITLIYQQMTRAALKARKNMAAP